MAKNNGWPREPHRHALASRGIPSKGQAKVSMKRGKGTEVPRFLFPPHVLEQIKQYNEIADGREWIAEFDLVNGSIIMNDFQFSDDVDASYLNWDGKRDSIYNAGYIHYHPKNLAPLFTAQDFVLGCKLHKMRSKESKEKIGYTLMGLVVHDRIILVAVKPDEARERQFESLIATDGTAETAKELRRMVADMQGGDELIRFNDIGLDGEDRGKAGGLII